MAIVVTLYKDKETKNAIRYSERRSDGVPNTKNVYLTKTELEDEFGKIPGALKATLEEA